MTFIFDGKAVFIDGKDMGRNLDGSHVMSEGIRKVGSLIFVSTKIYDGMKIEVG